MIEDDNEVIKLEDILDEESRKYLEFIDMCVKSIFFSGYPLRKEIAQKDLNKLWGDEVKISGEIINNNIVAYLQVKEIPNKFIIAGIYPVNIPIKEGKPNKEELEYWKEFLNPN